MLFLGSGAAKVNHGSQCEVGMPGPNPCSPTLSAMAADKTMSNGTRCVCGVCVSVHVCACDVNVRTCH